MISNMKKISITDIENVNIGQCEDKSAGTGCTVFVFRDGAPAGLDVRGGGPASRESELLKPTAAAEAIHAIVFAGGSAFGLDAAGGVMKCLEEHDIGFDVGVTRVPLVCQSSLFDLTVGRKDIRPDADMGYKACINAFLNNYKDGNYGAGTGATVGKLKGMQYCMKSGIGSYAVQIGDLKIGAVAAVNALGDVYDWKNGKKIAGMLTCDLSRMCDSEAELFKSYETVNNRFVSNTTLGVIITNAVFDKTKLCKIAGMAQDGYARSIRPVHLTVDGDSIYAVSTGDVTADLDMTGTLASHVMSEAILQAVKSAESAYDFPAACDLTHNA